MTSIRPFETIDRIEISNLTKTDGEVSAVSDVSPHVIGGNPWYESGDRGQVKQHPQNDQSFN